MENLTTDQLDEILTKLEIYDILKIKEEIIKRGGSQNYKIITRKRKKLTDTFKDQAGDECYERKLKAMSKLELTEDDYIIEETQTLRRK